MASYDVRERAATKMNLGATVRVNKCGVCVLVALMLLVAAIYKYGNTPELKREAVSLRNLLSAAIDAAERGGRIVYDIREAATLHEKSKGKTKEGANDPVTDGDLKSHLAMFYSLQKAFPGIKIISEEHNLNEVDVSSVSPAATLHPEVTTAIPDDQMVPAEDIRVWIDPLDATQEYTENLREYVTTMVCVAVRGRPTIGVIHKPFSQSTAWAWVGKAVSPSLRQAGNQAALKDDTAHIIVSRSHAGDVKAVATSAFGDKIEVIPAGGAGYKTLAVVEGKADAYVHSTIIKKWDLCAGNAILEALHGNMTTLQGKNLDYGSQDEYKNEGGVLATLTNHSFYLQKLQVLTNKKEKGA
ncbi:Golgi-resident adenosine 3',5'-bisphosphate 3'-phosphatase-like isoform X2 [Eriocheir sinensis]|uniref:Golgi-resident adenosine 3',5'-bisphosphate 3'-phosphatase-like isoform X2 n=1 Tax=Eriocheir sinensis TaxID=95602 RepID=UPI0021C76116|nr:Golgi-resident adenosine 3',5'-bisphosphate 3'-phosphatase-like isoform X2 [Eriocheir sinensis]